MKIHKRLIAATAAAVLTVTLAVPAFAIQQFTDVSPTKDAWCYTQVMKVTKAGLMDGFRGNYFGKNDPLTRVQIVKSLYNYCGERPATVRLDYFPDMPHDGLSATAIVWAGEKGIISGYSNGKFGPYDNLTREQMVTILYNAAGRPATGTSALDRFSDKDQVADYAVNAFSWAISNSVVSGTSNTTLSPQGTATRAQMAVILTRYIEKVKGDSLPEVVVPTRDTKGLNSDGTTNATYVNSLCNVGKNNNYPTTGDASTPNANGFYTNANVDISGAKLQYDVIPYVNEFLAKHAELKETNTSPWDTTMHWVASDEQEEYTLLRAKESCSYFEHERPDGTGILSGENLYRGASVAEYVIKAWENSSGHASTMLGAGYQEYTTCVASCGSVWVMTIWGNGNITNLISYAPDNYYCTK
mgnify:FL=1